MDENKLLPIFPLNAVLFPGGVLPLRVFEPRYTDMISECLRSSAEFGVCLIARGKEVGEPAEPELVGCRARIVDWNMEQLGLLQISTLGTTRFRILESSTSSAGLVRARVEDIEAEAPSKLPASMHACGALLTRIIDQLSKEAGETIDEHRFPIAKPYRLDDAGWVANRLCEILPISLTAKQKLMELTDAATRLALVHQHLVQHKIIGNN